jgi:FKBP-type peptidyl-prolyl cis-trans isomerase
MAQNTKTQPSKPASSSSIPTKPKSTSKLTTKVDSVSYSIGVNVGLNMRNQEVGINPEVLAMGVADAMATDINTTLKLTEEQLNAIFNRLQQEVMARQQERMETLKNENLAAANAFLEKNKADSSVVTTASGLQYRIMEAGSGKKPSPQSTVVVHYRGKLLDGKVFDSSFERGEPARFKLEGLIQGWIEGIPLMNEGSTYEFYIPANLGYGEEGNPSIPPNSLLIFEVKLIEVVEE